MSKIQIKLDWDNITFREAEKRIHTIMKNTSIEEIILYESSSQNGYHCICTTYFYIDPTLRYRLRRAWKDDGFRLVEDILNKSSFFRDVLFSYKRIKGFKFTRTKMFKYTRASYYNEKWLVTNLKTKNSLIYIQEPLESYRQLLL